LGGGDISPPKGPEKTLGMPEARGQGKKKLILQFVWPNHL